MATRTPKIPARSTLLNSSLDGMDDLFDFKTKEDLSQPEQENGGTGITEMDFAVMEPLPNHKFKLYTGQRLQDMVDSSLVIVDTWKRGGDRTNSNFCVMGNSGVGKSTAIKHILLSEYMKGTRIIVIDPESEYRDLCQNLNGDWINAVGEGGGR